MDSTTQVLTTLIILTAVVVTLIGTQFARRRRDFYVLRALPAYDLAPRLVGEAVESGRRVQLATGSAALGGASTALALASAEMLYQIASRTAVAGDSPLAVVGESGALPLMMGAIRRAYSDANRLDRYAVTAARWVPAASLAMSAALVADIGDERASGGVYVGEFDATLALPLESIARRRGVSVAGSTRLDGMAVAYAMADEPLIGEELFAAGAYLGDTPSHKAALAALDVLRWLVILGIIGSALVALRVPLTEGLARLSGGG
ncbi:MAG: hypothetical protein JNL42_21700 [Anaerolineae bacterium]|nr:hypothetical protein [Anaerolineae bacterium]